MINITIVTPWRQRRDQIAAYYKRIEALEWPKDNLRFVFVENDSTDGTPEVLMNWVERDARMTLIKRNMDWPMYPSVVNAKRFEILATVFNWGLDAVDYDWTDYVLFLPCDIRYNPDLLRRLIVHQAAVVAPLVFQNERFYDIWAFSREGKNFTPFPRQSVNDMTPLIECETMGCTMLIDADVLRAGVRYSPVDVDRGFCTAARALGYTLFADSKTHVEHGA